jgi:hypothetical protein
VIRGMGVTMRFPGWTSSARTTRTRAAVLLGVMVLASYSAGATGATPVAWAGVAVATAGTGISTIGVPAVSTKVWTDRGDYAPGSTASIGGSGFFPAEKVDLQVVHADGRPDTDSSHVAWTVTADSGGAFSATWLVDAVDAVGSTLQVTSTGETSRATARALFKDSGRPFWVFGHNPNSEDDATTYMQLGANALEPDIEFDDDAGLVVRHDTTVFSSNHDLVAYLKHLAVLAGQYNLALMVFDVKSDAATHPGAALELSNDIQTYLLSSHPEVSVILSVASTSDADAFFPSLKGTTYNDLFGFQIDGENTPSTNVNHLHAMLDQPGDPAKIGYGNGTAGCCNQLGGAGPFLGPNVATSLQKAVWDRTGFGSPNIITYGYAVTDVDTIKMLIDSGVDGLIGSDMPLEFGSFGNGDTKDILSLVNAHYDNVYLATSADDPFSVPGAQGGVETGSRQGYALEVKTDDSNTSGTDSHITFTVHGELGDASTTIDSYFAGQMEDGDVNQVFVPSADLGHLKSVTVEHDDAGNGPDWNPDWIKVRSFAYIGADCPYPTPGDPNTSTCEYYADYGGQTISEDTPVTVDLHSGIPTLATNTNGDLVLHMGPSAAARGSGNVTDGDESFTVHHVSTQADGTETVTVSAFGLRPQPYKGVKQIHADGGAGADSLTVDGAFTIPIFFHGGGDSGDRLVLQNASFDTVTHRFTNAHDGTVALDPDGAGPLPAAVVTYTGLAPITDTLIAANRGFDFTGAAETITMSDDPGAAAGISRIDSTLSESVDFTHPTETMTVDASAGTGPDTIDVQPLGPAFNASTTVNASNGGGDHLTVQTTTGTTNTWMLHGGTGGDTFDIQGTGATTSVIAASASLVHVGSAGDAQGVNGTLNIENPANLNTVTVDDSVDTTGRTAVLGSFANGADSQANSDAWGRLHGLAPADINFEYADTAGIDIKTGHAADAVAVQATGTPTTIETGAGADTVTVSSDAPAGQGTLAGIAQALTIDAGPGGNRLVVSDLGGPASTNAVVTDNRITGMAPADITYAASGGTFTDGPASDGILLRGSNTGSDTFLVASTLALSTTTIEGNGGADTVNIGSTPPDNNGNLDTIAGPLRVIGGNPGAPAAAFPNTVDPTGQTDVLYLNDRGATGKQNYRVGDYTNDGVDNPLVAAETSPSTPARAFAGVSYDATMDYVRVDGTDDVNTFDVRPSLTTQYYIDGNLPAPGGCLPGGGDYLRLDTTGTTGRKLHITAPGAGFWSFTSGHRPVDFESIERFNHVDVLATAPDAGTSAPAVVKLYDAETGDLLSQISPFENSFKGGVRVATGDINCDGLPDVIVAPGPGRDPVVKIYDGSPDASGSHPATLMSSFPVFPTTFKGGVNLAVGDVNADGNNDLVLASDTGAPPSLKVLDGRYVLTSHAALSGAPTSFPAKLTGGINLAVGDLNNDGYADIVTVNGASKNTTVSIVSGNGYGLVKTFTPFGPGAGGSTPSVAIGDFDGDGHRDIVLGSGAATSGTASVFSGTPDFTTWTPGLMTSFQPYGTAFDGSIRLTVKPTDGGNPGTVEKVNILTAPGPGNGTFPRLIRQASFAGYGPPPLLTDKLAENPAYNGIFIG